MEIIFENHCLSSQEVTLTCGRLEQANLHDFVPSDWVGKAGAWSISRSQTSQTLNPPHKFSHKDCNFRASPHGKTTPNGPPSQLFVPHPPQPNTCHCTGASKGYSFHLAAAGATWCTGGVTLWPQRLMKTRHFPAPST